MALLFMDGWDHYTNLADKGYYSLSSCAINSTAGRYSGGCFNTVGYGVGINQTGGTAYGYGYRNLPKDTSYVFSGFAYQAGLITNGHWIIGFGDAALGEQIDVRSLATGQLYITRNGTQLGSYSSINTPLLVSRWYHIQLCFYISATNGWAEVYLDSNLVISYYGTGVDRASADGNTKAQTSSIVNRIRLDGTPQTAYVGGPSYYLDDLYVCDNTGSVNNDHLGDVRVLPLYPSAPGAFTDLSLGGSSPSATNWQSVDETSNHNSDTDYVYSNTVGQRDTYVYQDLPATASSVKAVAASFVSRKDTSGNRTVAPDIYTAATEIPMTALAYQPGTSYFVNQEIIENNPNTAAPWTVSDVNGSEFGLKIIT